MNKLLWAIRYARHMKKRSGMKFTEAYYWAHVALDDTEAYEDFADDPEGAADEEMSCWSE